jgi:peroxiredoxin
MIIDDGVLTTLAVEESPPLMEVSGADKILAAL